MRQAPHHFADVRGVPLGYGPLFNPTTNAFTFQGSSGIPYTANIGKLIDVIVVYQDGRMSNPSAPWVLPTLM